MGRRQQPARPIAGRRRWLAASSLAMATAMLAAPPASAQVTPIAAAGQGTVTVQSGTVNSTGTVDGVRTVTPETRTGGLRDTITIASNEVVLLWNPVDTGTGGGDILFLGRNDAIRFQRDGSTYTVINRVIPTDQTRAIRFEGLVESYINTGVHGGNVFFYSPGGIVVGSTGRFDVGSLVLSSVDIVQTVSTSTTLAFAQRTEPLQAGAKVRIDPWTTGAFDNSSQIDTFGGGNAYVALVAPTVEQMGRVNSAGNVAYVAAEAATMTIAGSLFDIVVNTGTTSTKGIEHGADAVTTGSAYGGPSRRIQMVAVPKNVAMTMLVSGTVGYQQASSAGIVNGRIVLTAGTAGDDADIQIREASFLQSVTATASDDIRISADGAGASIAVDDGMNALDFTASAGGSISVDLTNGAGMNVSGNMSLTAGSGATGGDIAITTAATGVAAPTAANGIQVGGNLTLDSSSTGADDISASGVGGDALSGDISIAVSDGAQFFVGGNLAVDTSATPGFGGLQAGSATAGEFSLTMTGEASTVDVDGGFSVDARAFGAFNPSSAGFTAAQIGNDSSGGRVALSFSDGNSSLDGGLSIQTDAQASNGRIAGVAQDNSAQAGDISLSYTGGSHTAFFLDFNASGTAGTSFDGAGNTVAGTVGRALVSIALDDASVTTADDNTIDASTSGDISASAAGEAITLTAINGSTFASGFFEALASHDNGISTNPGTAGGISITADSSTVALGSLTLESSTSASSSVAADKTGGAITVSASNGSLITASGASLRSGVSEPTGAVGPSVNTGGAISLIATDSDITFTGGTQLDASVDVSRGGDGSAAPSTGGAITIRQIGSDSDLTFNDLSLSASAALPDGGTDDFLGNGGDAAGGTVTVDVQGGNFTADSLSISTFATGQTGGSQIAAPGDFAGDGGSARSGDILVTAAGTSFDPGVVFLSNAASGGTGGTGLSALGAAGAGAGGAAEGGAVVFDLLAGTVNLEAFLVILPPIDVIGPFLPPSIPSFDFGSIAVGGTGGFGDGTPGGAGGAATGGTAIFNSAGADVTVSTAAVGVFSGAYGGAGGDSQFNSGTGSYGGPAGAGGTATGGTATYLFTGGTTNVTAALVDASAFGGIGGNHVGFSGGPLSAGGMGGSAFGGTATITLGADDTSSALYTVTARATGGDGGDGPLAGAGGDAEGGDAQFNVANASVNAYSIDIDASAYGGDGGYPGRTGAPGGAGGNAIGGDAGIDVFGLSGALATDQGIDITSTGIGGEGGRGGYLGDGGAGGYGRGGSILIAARDGAGLELLTSNAIDARGRGGDGGPAGGYDGNPPGAGGNGGAGYGGSIEVSASNATLTASSVEGPVQFSATGTGGSGGSSGYSGYYGYYGGQGTPGGNGISAGGSINLGAFDSGLFQVNGDLRADASGIGRLDTRLRSTGSDAAGGAVRLDIDSGGAFVVTGNAMLEASALATWGRDAIGNATGGTVDVTMNDTLSVLDIGGSLRADVSATDNRAGGFFSAAPTGGNTEGGEVTFDFLAGTVSVGGTLELFAMAGIETSEGSVLGGSARGGDISLLNDGAADLTFADVTIDSSARGTFGNRPSGGTQGEAGGDAFGGNVTLSNRGTGSLTATSIAIDAGAQGGYGGRGTEGSYGAGGAGGSAVGGTVLVANGSTMAVQDLTVVADAIGGQGGSGAGGFDGGTGGQGEGGAITFTSSQTIANLNQLSLSASGTGGAGARGDSYYGYYGQGSRGGDGAGGSISFDFAGAGTTLSGLATFIADTDGNGGSGGTGASSYGDGTDGGTGGDGSGGSLTIAARSGALIDLSSTGSLSSNGNGGVGGDGGAGGYADGTGSYGGDGGAGGNGTGGSVTLIAQGGTIAGGTIQFTASGYGGRAGYGGTGYYDYGTYGGGVGGRLAGGSGTGGLVSLQALEGSPGVITLGAVTIDASGFLGGSGVTVPTVGGSIEIIDASTDPAGLITMGSLVATALGAIPPADASFTMSGDSGPITILDALSVNVVGDIVFDFDGSGHLVVGGTTSLNSGGDILLTHTNNSSGVISIDSTGNFTATAGGFFSAGSGSIANGGGNVSIIAQDITYDAIDALGFVRLNALTGSIRFAGTGMITAGTLIDLDAAQAVTIGDADAETGFTINAGGDVAFGTITNSSSDLSVVAGGSISGVSAINDAPVGSGGLSRTILSAGGDITLTGVAQSVKDGVFLTATGNIAAGTIDAGINAQAFANGTVAVGTVNAGTGALLQGTSVTVDNGSVGGNLVVTATSGSIAGSGTIAVGGTADLDAPGSISFGSLTAGTGFTANAGGDIVFDLAGTTGGDLVFAAGGSVLGGDLDVAGLLSLTGTLISIGNASGTNLSLGSSSDILFDSLTSPNAVSLVATNGTIGANTGAGDIDSGGNISLLAQAVALGDLTSGGSLDAEATAGDITFGRVIVAGDIVLDAAAGFVSVDHAEAGGDFIADSLTGFATGPNSIVTVGDILISTGGAADLGNSSAGGVIDVTANHIDFITLVAGGTIDLLTLLRPNGPVGDGGIVGGAMTAGAGGSSLDAFGSIAVTGPLDIGGSLTVSAGGSATLGAVDAGTSFTGSTGGDFEFGSIDATGDVAVSAGGQVGIAPGGTGTITTTGGVDFDAAGNISFGDATVAGLIDVDAGGSIATGTVIARDIQLTAALDIVSASLVSANANAGMFDRVLLDAGGDIVVTGLTRGTDLVTFNAGGSVDAGDILSDGTVTIDAASIAIGSATAGGFALISDSDILFDSLTSNSAVSLTAASGTIGANEGPGDIASSGDVSLLAQAIALGEVSSGGSVGATATTGNASFGTIDAANDISVTAAGTPTIASAISGGNTSITGASVTFNSGAIGGDLSLTATTGSIDSNGTVNVGGGIALAASDGVSFGTLAAQGGDFTVSAGGAIGFTAGSANGGIDFAAGGAIAGESLSADGAITAEAGTALTLGSANAGDALDLRAGSTLTLADAIGGTVALRSASGAVIVTNDIDSTFSGDGQQVIVSGAAVQIDDVNDLLLTFVQATNGDIDAVAAGDIGVVSAESAGDINLTSTGGDVRVSLAEAGKTGIVPTGTGGTIAPAGTQVGSPGPGNISILAGGLAQGSFVASGDIGIDAGSTIDLTGADAGGAIALSSGGSTRVFGTAAAGGDIAIDSGGDVRVTSSNASLEAGGDLLVQAAGTFDTQGFAYGTNVAVTAGDVVIGASGKVGDAGQTTSVTFTGIGTINVGGDAVAANFSLDADEIGRIENSGDLTFRALTGSSNNGSGGGTIGTAAVNTSGPARIVVGEMAVAAGSGGQMGSSSTLLLDSQGTIDVLGSLTVAGAGEEGSLRIRSNGATWLDTAGGNLRIEDGSGAATGIIDISSGSFMAVSADALADIDGLGAADIDARLADNDGVVRSDGFIQAGTLDVRVRDAFFVQNSGEGDSSDLDTRRGFAVEFLSIDTGEGASPLIVINGTVGGQTGIDALQAASIGSGFVQGSTVNGCLIANPAGCIPIAPPPESDEVSFDDPARDLIEEDFDPAIELEGDLESQLIDLSPSEEFQDDPLIDDPVTGAGNEDLWVGEPSCEPGSEDEASCPTSKEAQPEGQQAQEEMEPAE